MASKWTLNRSTLQSSHLLNGLKVKSLKLTLSDHAKNQRKRKVLHVVSAAEHHKSVNAGSSELALELSEAKSEISLLKKELIHQKRQLSKDFDEKRQEENRISIIKFEQEKADLIEKLSKEHRHKLLQQRLEHEEKSRIVLADLQRRFTDPGYRAQLEREKRSMAFTAEGERAYDADMQNMYDPDRSDWHC